MAIFTPQEESVDGSCVLMSIKPPQPAVFTGWVHTSTLNQWITQTFLFKIPPTYHKSWKSLTAFLRTPAVFQWYLSGRGVFCVLFLKITYSTFDFLFSMLTVLFSLYVLYCTCSVLLMKNSYTTFYALMNQSCLTFFLFCSSKSTIYR